MRCYNRSRETHEYLAHFERNPKVCGERAIMSRRVLMNILSDARRSIVIGMLMILVAGACKPAVSFARPYSIEELKAAQQQVNQVGRTLGIHFDCFILEKENRVIVTVGNPQLFLDEVGAAGLELHPAVKVVALNPDHLSDTLRGEVDTYAGPDGQTIYFPKQAPTNVYWEALSYSRLLLDSNGCLRAERQEGDDLLILWHSDFDLRVTGGVVEVLNGDGEVVGRTGQVIIMGGGFIPDDNPRIPGMPIEACPGPYWRLGAVDPLDEQKLPGAFATATPTPANR
jgi:hypothetical protein